MTTRKKLAAFLVIQLLSALVLTNCNPAVEIDVACSAGDLIQAINTANANSNTTVLNLLANCAYTFTNADNSDGGHGFNALPIITTPIRMNGNNATLRRTSAAISPFRFFLVTDTGGLRLDDMTLIGGNSIETADEIDPGGGAIYNDGGEVTLNKVSFRTNHNMSNGGAIFNRGTLIIDHMSIFSYNYARFGGAIFNADYNGIPITINNSIFRVNWAEKGGALYNRSAETEFLIGNVEFDYNTSSSRGGAIYTEDGHFTIAASAFEENGVPVPGTPGTTPPVHGGAIFIEDGTFNISRTLMALNQAGESGGAIYNANGALSLHDEISLSSNTASVQPSAGNSGHGGGIYNETGSVDISEAYFFQNSTQTMNANGGAIYNQGTATIVESAFSSNLAYHGGAIYNGGQLTATNVSFTLNIADQNGGNIINLGNLSLSFVTLLAGNADRGRSIFQIVGSTQIKNSILYDPGMQENCDIGGAFQALGDNIDNVGDCPGTFIHADPMLDSFANYGGYTPTFALLPGSVALDAVTDCTDVAGVPVAFDQRHADRLWIAGQCDIGAYEEEAQLLPTPPQLTDTPTPTITVTTTPTEVPPTLYAPQNTTCRKGDSIDHEDVGYLLTGESAEVIGRNQAGTWLVINNPDRSGICWIYRAIVETEGDVDGTKVYIPPPRPTKTPTEVLGCLVQETRGGDPVCTVPCPEGAEPGTPCTP